MYLTLKMKSNENADNKHHMQWLQPPEPFLGQDWRGLEERGLEEWWDTQTALQS